MKAAHCKVTLILLCLSMLLTGCGQSRRTEGPTPSAGTESSAQNPSSTSAAEGSEKTEYQVSAMEGAILSVPSGDKARIDISLPAGALVSDVMIEIAPLNNSSGESWIAAGFDLSEAGKSGLTLQSPACICYVSSDELPENASIVKYIGDDKDYTPVPSQRFETPEAFGLIAYVDSLSAYGVKSVTNTELRKMADEMREKGFNWSLTVSDRDGFTEGETSYEAYLDMVLVNSQAPSSVVMSGPYQGVATMQSKAVVTLEGAPFGFSLVEAKDDTASFTLYPVFEQYLPEPGSSLAPLSGLVPIRYEGEGVLNMRNPIDIGGAGGEDGMNMMEVARQFEAEWGIDLPEMTEEGVPFTVVTDGPMAYITLQVSNGAILKLTGSIVGYSKDQRPELAPLTEGSNEAPPTKTEGTQFQDETGTIHYDIDGDGQTDFTLFPLDLE